MKIFVARLPHQYQEAQISELFAAYGTVNSVNLIMDRETGRSKCFAFVEMPDSNEANNAIAELNERRVLDKNIAVSEAREKERPAGNSGGGNRNFRSSGGGDSGGGYKKYGNDDKRGGGNYNRGGNDSGGGYKKYGNDDRRGGGGNGNYRDRSSSDSDY